MTVLRKPQALSVRDVEAVVEVISDCAREDVVRGAMALGSIRIPVSIIVLVDQGWIIAHRNVVAVALVWPWIGQHDALFGQAVR